MSTIPICLIVEDNLSATIASTMLHHTKRGFEVGSVFGLHGNGWIKTRIAGFNNAAQGMPYLVITDLDANPCPIKLISEWLNVSRHQNLIFRVAVREVEAWLLADRKGIASFLNVSETHISRDVEELSDPKQSLIEAARRSRKRDIREDIVPVGLTSKIGPDYNGRLGEFVVKHWNLEVARANSESLERAMRALEHFRPV
jgi:hypothetical protein